MAVVDDNLYLQYETSNVLYARCMLMLFKQMNRILFFIINLNVLKSV